MCHSAPISLVTFLFSTTISIYLWKRNLINDRVLATWVFVVSLIQLCEFFMWSDYDNKKGWNNLATKISLIVIIIQPLVLGAGVYFYGDYYKSMVADIILKATIIILTIKVIAATLFVYSRSNEKWLSKKGKNCHLIWHYNNPKKNKHLPFYKRIDTLSFFTPLALITLMLKPYPWNLIYFTLGALSLYIIFIMLNPEAGSYWCWIANILSISIVLSKYFFVK